MRRGDSKNVTVLETPEMADIQCVLSFGLRGGKPKTVSGRTANPETTTAVIAAETPGTGSTGIPSNTHARTSSSPGSEIPGVPASETMAIERSDRSCASSSGRRRFVLWAWKLTVLVEIP